MRKHRSLIGVLLGAAFLLSLVPLVFAGTEGSDCSGDSSVVRIWENPINDTSDGDDSKWFCGSVANLAVYPHNLPGNCHAPFFGSTTWNDCIDSYTLRTPTGWWLCFYADANYSHFIDSRQGWNERFNILSPDTLTSFNFQSGSTC